MTANKIIRCIEFFEKKGDRLVYKIALPSRIGVNELSVLFDTTNDPMMYEGYLIEEKKLKYFEKLIGKKIDNEKYDCFVACYTDDLVPKE